MKKSKITLNIGQLGNSDKSKIKNENISDDEMLKKKCNFGEMIHEDGIGMNYDNFKKPFDKGKDQKFAMDCSNILFSNYVKFITFLEEIRKISIQKIKEFKLNDLKLLIKLVIQQKEENSFKIICCKYSLESPIILDINKKRYEDNNILIKEKFENFELFIKDVLDFINSQRDRVSNHPDFGISSIELTNTDKNFISRKEEFPHINSSNKEEHSKINYRSQLLNDNKSINLRSDFKSVNESTHPTLFYNLSAKTSKTNIEVLTKIIGTHKKKANYIMELENGYLISGGPNNIILYNNNNSYIKAINKDHYSICPVKNEKGNIDLVINREDGIYASSFNNNTIEEFFRRIKCDTNCKFCFNLNKTFLICNNEGFFQYNDILGKIIEIKGNLIKKQQFFGGIKINDYLVALASNKESPNGEDKICFYNNNSKKIYKDIKGYSFTKSQNNLALISKKNQESKKLLLCACTKYNENQKNGILLIRIQFDDKQEEKALEEFYETGNFEVHCFCQLFKFENNNVILDGKKKLIDTNLFFVGGYDREKNLGLIKLYKINYDEENFDKTSIEFNKDIEILYKKEKKINEIKKPISCIIQSTNTGKIIFTSFDGNVYLVTNKDINDLKDNLKNG